MQYLITVSLLATLVGLGGTVSLKAEATFNTADTISLSEDHPNSFRNFSAELPQMKARVPEINTEFGLHVSEIEPGLYFVTDMVYQSAFLVTDEGVVVFDAPPSFGEGLKKIIEATAPDTPITHFIMSHAHMDHNGGGTIFGGVPGLKVIAAQDNAATLAEFPLAGVLTPTQTYQDATSLTVGGVQIDLRASSFHSEDIDTIIYLPEQKFLMAVDTITPGEAPFMNFGATSNFAGYIENFETFLSYDFEHFLSGHVSVLGNRDDVIMARDYAFDVRDTVADLMPTMNDLFMKGMTAVEFQHANLAYRYAMEVMRDDCSGQIIERWQGKLSVVDLWADSHCETAVLYGVMH